MSNQISTIEPGKGLGIIRFGITREQLKEILGEPEETDLFYLDEGEKSASESWYYDKIGLSFSFEAEQNWKLITIEADADNVTLNGQQIIGISKSELYTLLEKMNIDDIYEEATPMEEAETHELVSSNQKELNFWLEEERVTEIQWGPFYTTDDEIIWPN